MVLDLPQLERTAGRPLVDQIVEHYRSVIRRGRLRPGDRLPTIRLIADQLQVTRNTVQEAYRRLSEHGLVAATVGRGTVVAPAGHPGAGSVGEIGVDAPSIFSPGALAACRQQAAAPANPPPPADVPVRANFGELLPDQGLFPVEEFRASLESVLRQRGGDLLMYGHPAGNPDLRRLLAARRECADPAGDPDEVLITSGAQQGIDLVLRTFTAPGDAVAVAVPTYHQLFGLLSAHGVELVPVTAGPAGIDTDELARVLARPDVRLLCLMPTFHNPTGRTLDLAQRQELIRVVEATRVPVLEDEFQRELRFAGEPLPSLRALDPRGLTVTVRTFSKGLFPGVRTGWVQASTEVVGPMATLKRVTDLETSPLLQAALAHFLVDGALDRHLETLRVGLAERHAAAQEALAAHLPDDWTWSRPQGGFALWVEGPPTLDSERLADLAGQRGVRVTPGRIFDPLARPGAGMRLSLSRVTPEEIREGIEILGRCAREWLARSDPFQRTNFL